MSRWQDTHDPLCPSYRAKNWQVWFGPIWCMCNAIRLGRLEGEQDFRRLRAVVLSDLRAKVAAMCDEAGRNERASDEANYVDAAYEYQAEREVLEKVLALLDGDVE